MPSNPNTRINCTNSPPACTTKKPPTLPYFRTNTYFRIYKALLTPSCSISGHFFFPVPLPSSLPPFLPPLDWERELSTLGLRLFRQLLPREGRMGASSLDICGVNEPKRPLKRS